MKFCCNLGKYFMFGIYFIYDIGLFFVIIIIYRYLMFYDKDFGIYLNFFGFMMIYIDEGVLVCYYFVSILKGFNRDIENILFVRCDILKVIVKGLFRVLFIV